MITTPIGAKFYDNDAEIRVILESENLWEQLKPLMENRSGGICQFIPEPGTDIWIIQCFMGVPGDEGWALSIIPFKAIDHPIIQEWLRAVEITFQIDAKRGIELHWHKPVKKGMN